MGSKIESIERLNHCVWHLCSVATPEWLRGSPLSRPTPEPEPVQCELNQRPCHSSADCGLYTQKADVSLIRTFHLLTFSKTVGRPLICNSIVRKTLFKEFFFFLGYTNKPHSVNTRGERLPADQKEDTKVYSEERFTSKVAK